MTIGAPCDDDIGFIRMRLSHNVARPHLPRMTLFVSGAPVGARRLVVIEEKHEGVLSQTTDHVRANDSGSWRYRYLTQDGRIDLAAGGVTISGHDRCEISWKGVYDPAAGS